MKRFSTYAILILIIFHIVGIVLFKQNPNNAELSYLNLTLCGALLLLSEGLSIGHLSVFGVIFIGGIVIEYIGVQTGYLFGDYSYGSSLGTKIFGIPLVIGINWYAIVLSSSSLVRNLKMHIGIKAILAGLLAASLDFIIEPIAARYDMWNWETQHIPFYNYFCWFLFSSLFAWLYLRQSKQMNRTAFALFPIWTIFFVILYWI